MYLCFTNPLLKCRELSLFSNFPWCHQNCIARSLFGDDMYNNLGKTTVRGCPLPDAVLLKKITDIRRFGAGPNSWGQARSLIVFSSCGDGGYQQGFHLHPKQDNGNLIGVLQVNLSERVIIEFPEKVIHPMWIWQLEIHKQRLQDAVCCRSCLTTNLLKHPIALASEEQRQRRTGYLPQDTYSGH